MVRTHGLTHISLAVRDPDRSLAFYREVFGLEEIFRDEESIQAQTPGNQDIIALVRDAASAGRSGGVSHFGFRLLDPSEMEAALAAVERGGGTILRRGDHAPGVPFAYVNDPDGYEVEIWYE